MNLDFLNCANPTSAERTASLEQEVAALQREVVALRRRVDDPEGFAGLALRFSFFLSKQFSRPRSQVMTALQVLQVHDTGHGTGAHWH